MLNSEMIRHYDVAGYRYQAGPEEIVIRAACFEWLSKIDLAVSPDHPDLNRVLAFGRIITGRPMTQQS